MRGFSLLELLVAVAIFTLVMTIATGALISMLGVNLKNRTTVVATNNLNVALQSMTRSLQRVDENGFSISIAGDEITFDTHAFDGVAPQTISFRLHDGAIERSLDGGGWVRMTAQGVEVTELTFALSSPSGGDVESVRISVSARVGDPSVQGEFTEIHAQTTVSQGLFVPHIISNSIVNDVPYCPIPANTPGLSLLVPFEAKKNSHTFVSNMNGGAPWITGGVATIYQNVSQCYWGSPNLPNPPYNHLWNRRCGCQGTGAPFCTGYDSSTPQNGVMPSAANRFRAGSTNGYPGEAWNRIRYPHAASSTFALPPGEYEVLLAAWDDHCATQTEVSPGVYTFSDCTHGPSSPSPQVAEQIVAELIFDVGPSIITTLTDDIPDDKNFIVPVKTVASIDTNPDVAYPAGRTLERVTVYHAGCIGMTCDDPYDLRSAGPWPLGSSVIPACIAFQRTDGATSGAAISPMIPE